MSIKTFKVTSSHGDTIVEVLVAISIIGAILLGAFISSNRSSQAVRTAQERTEALKLAETQVEQIKIARDKNTTVPASPATFCFDSTGTPQTNPHSACIIDPSGIRYSIAISQQAAPNNTSYVVKVDWDALGGTHSSVELDYKTQ